MNDRDSLQNGLAEFNKFLENTIDSYLKYFPNESTRLSQLTTNFQNNSLDLRQRSTIPQGHVTASGIILSLDKQKALMLYHKILGIWVVPGGHFDLIDVTPDNTALRETSEETGYSSLVLDPWHVKHNIPLDIDTHPIPANSKKNEGEHVHFDFRYVIKYDQNEEVNIDLEESSAFKWIDLSKIDPRSSIHPAIAKFNLLTVK